MSGDGTGECGENPPGWGGGGLGILRFGERWRFEIISHEKGGGFLC